MEIVLILFPNVIIARTVDFNLMKRIVLLSILTTLFYNCKNDENLIGSWYETNGNYLVEFEFHQDNSFKYYANHREYFGKWKSKNSRIYFELKDSISNKTYDKFELDYKFIEDYLFLKHPRDSVFIESGFIKFDDRFKQWQNYLGLRIGLKTSTENLNSSIDGLFSKEVYIGFRDNEIVSQIDNNFISLEEKAKIITFEFKKQKPPETKNEDLKFVLIIDENISEFKIDSIKNILRETPVKKIFRVYKNDIIDYRDLNWHNKYLQKNNDIEWFGLYE